MNIAKDRDATWGFSLLLPVSNERVPPGPPFALGACAIETRVMMGTLLLVYRTHLSLYIASACNGISRPSVLALHDI
ncbi:MAG: hypothetical protein Q4D93_04045 [Porphyromonas sp.]|nr:hypothetical protein [Porphyromonas sp.]